jgi:hypothetical protein
MKRLTVFLIACVVLIASCVSPVSPVDDPLPVVSTPIIIPPGGKIFTTDTITITCVTPGATIAYTTDGTDPTICSTAYSKPILVSVGTVVIKAMAFAPYYTNSGISVAAFTVSTSANRYVYNSRWNLIQTAMVNASKLSRDIVSEDALALLVATHNAEYTDDQYFLENGEVPITEAPNARVWIVKPHTYERLPDYDGIVVDRSLVDGRYDVWVMQAQYLGGILYLDKTPPDVTVYNPPVDTRPDYEKYAIYALDSSGAIMVETHCEDYNPATMAATKDEYFAQRVLSFQNDVNQHQGTKSGEPWSLISGQLYTPPSN